MTMSMTDTQLLDFCESALKQAAGDGRYPANYTFILGTMTLSINRLGSETFRELLEKEFHKRITERLMK